MYSTVCADHTEMDDLFMLENEAHVKDMEAAAVAWVVENCSRRHRASVLVQDGEEDEEEEEDTVPFFAIKVVTDIVDGEQPTQDEFLSNLSHASKTLSETLIKVVYFLENKHVDEL